MVSQQLQQPGPQPKPSLRVQLVHKLAKLPMRGSPGAAGYDLCSVESVIIEKHGGRAAVDTGIKIHIPDGMYGRVAPRSGLALRHGIDTGAGVIDSDYRGVVKVILFNHGDQDFSIKPGDRIAQLILEYIATPDVEQVDNLDSSETMRGSGGFGSTGGFGFRADKLYEMTPQNSTW